MMRIINLEQGSPDWHEWRKTGIGASDACHIVGTAPWNSKEKLRAIKLGRYTEPYNSFMRRGVEREPAARLLFQQLTGIHIRPVCVVHDEIPYLKASLDGLSEDGKTVVEIKCPTKPDVHNDALRGKVKPYYLPQVHHQLLVTGADRCLFVSYFPEAIRSIAIVEVVPDSEYMDRLLTEEKKFWKSLTEGVDGPDLSAYNNGT